MSDVPADRVEISPVPSQLRADALELVFSRLSTGDRATQVGDLLARVEDDPRALDGLFTVSVGGELLGAGLSQLQPGRSAVVWTAPPEPNMPQQATIALLRALTDFAARNGALLAQSLLTAEQTDEKALTSAGFQHASDLAFLFASAESFPTEIEETGLKFQTYSPDMHGRLAAVIEETYVDTLDCPAMNGVRDVGDVMTGYRATGSFSPDRWLVARAGQRDVGCLLLADHPAAGQWELVYMGLIPVARGKGYGAMLARRALWMAGQAGRRGMVVAVDRANRPALAVYEAAGFISWDTRRVFLKPLNRGDVPQADGF